VLQTYGPLKPGPNCTQSAEPGPVQKFPVPRCQTQGAHVVGECLAVRPFAYSSIAQSDAGLGDLFNRFRLGRRRRSGSVQRDEAGQARASHRDQEEERTHDAHDGSLAGPADRRAFRPAAAHLGADQAEQDLARVLACGRADTAGIGVPPPAAPRKERKPAWLVGNVIGSGPRNTEGRHPKVDGPLRQPVTLQAGSTGFLLILPLPSAREDPSQECAQRQHGEAGLRDVRRRDELVRVRNQDLPEVRVDVPA
jgi:hypothetical protein